MNYEKYLEKNCKSLKGKWVALTGSTGGLGKYIASFVARLGGNLILLNRNVKKSEQQAKLLQESFGVETKIFKVDMADMNSVRNTCEKLQSEKIDFLILNAGAYSLPREKADTGYDVVYQINFISPYFMVKELLGGLSKNAGRVVVVGSIAHKYSNINSRDVDFSNEKAPRKVYGNAKRFLMFSLTRLFSQEKNASLVLAHPGITPTNITSHYSKFVQAVVKYPMKMIFTSPRKSSLNIIKSMFCETNQNQWVGPRFFNIWGKPKIKSLNTCRVDEQNKIFEIAENIYQNLKKID